jgi:hypothetical protein
LVTNPIAKNTIGYKPRVDNLYPLSEANSPMLTTGSPSSAELAIALLTHYSFDLSGYTARELIYRWQNQYPENWLHSAVVEALYQGRYKAISVQQILAFWQRRGQVVYHFNMEFERLICSQFPESLTQPLTRPVLPPIQEAKPEESVSIRPNVTAQALPATVGHSYRQTQTATLELMNVAAQQQQEENILVSSTLRSTASGNQERLNSEPHSHSSSQLPQPHQTTKLLPPAASHPPIGQFTPAISEKSDSFTSKLKAISDDQG